MTTIALSDATKSLFRRTKRRIQAELDRDLTDDEAIRYLVEQTTGTDTDAN